MPALESGETVDARFDVEATAGAGGMGCVYRCRDQAGGGPVALKVMGIGGKSNRARFAREVRVLSELRHPNIVRYVSHGSLPDARPYLAMEWIEGPDLGRAIAERQLSVSDALSLFRRLSDALGEAHARGIIHRDIKPENVILQDGKLDSPKLVDFGLAREVDPSRAITKAGAMVGTPAYMAPEQARRDSEPDARSDVFSLGCVLFECLAGHPAFRGPNMVSVLCKILLDAPPWLGDVRQDLPEPLVALVAQMLDKDPEKRPPDATAVRDALASIDAARASRVSRQPALGEGEQRYISVIIAGWPHADSQHTPPTTLGMPRVMRGVRRAVEPFDTEIHQMVDGTVVLMLRGGGAAQDRVGRAARCALAIRAMVPEEPVVMATGRGMLLARQPIGAVIDEAASLLHAAAMGRQLQADTVAKAVTVPGVSRAPSVPRPPVPMAIQIDDVSARLLDARFQVDQTEGRFELRGYDAEPIEPRTLLGRVMPCVGRNRELAIVRAAWDECIEESAAQAVVVTGEAGIGKSRLVRQWVSELYEGKDRPLVLSVRADPMGAGGAFGMIARLVRAAAGAHGGLDDGEVQGKLHALVARQVAPADRQRVADFLCEMVGVGPADADSVSLRAARHDPVLRSDQIRRAFIDWLAAEAQARPLVIVLEDLQWGDVPTVELVDAALRALEDCPIYVIALARPEVEESFPNLWAGRNATRLGVGPLRKRAAVQLVRTALGDVDDGTAEMIAERSGGHPFLLEELVRAHAENRSEVPDTVLASLQARFDDFSPSLRLVLRAASIFGDVFTPDAVSALVGDQAPDTLGLLRTLVEREVLVYEEVRDGLAPHAMSFAQGLWRDAAYASFTEDDRKLGHGLAAAWFERHRPRDARAIGEHYALGEAPERAAHHFAVAARHALQGGDFQAALDLVGRARAHGGGEGGGLHVVEAVAHKWRGDNEAAARAAEQAVQQLAPGRVEWLEAVGEGIAACGKLGRGDALVAHAARLTEVSAANDEADRARVIALCRAITQLVLAGRTDQADPLLRFLQDGQVDTSIEGWVFEARAVRAGSAQDPGARIEMAQRAAACFEAAGDVRNACLQLTSVGFGLNEAGAYQRAHDALEEAIALGTRMALDNAVATAQAQLGRAQSRLGRYDEARLTLPKAIEALVEQKNRRLEGVARSYLAWSLCEAGERQKAEREARTAVEVLSDLPPLLAGASALLARTLLKLGRSQDAAEHAQRASALLERLGSLPTGEAAVRLAQIEVLLAEGKRKEAGACAMEACAALDKRVSRLPESDLRQAFDAVEEHVRTRELRAQLC